MKFECPICGYTLGLDLSIDATLKSLDDMNWKHRVKNAIKSLPWELVKGEAYIEINELIKDLNLEEK